MKFLAACNGTTAGGGYELALACDEIILVDDRSSAVSLPELPLLGVLPGTGGLTRVTDKRKVRRDYADMFCTLTEGVRAPRAKEWGLIDSHVKPQQFATAVRQRALELAALIGFTLVLTLYFQLGLGYPPLAAALVNLPHVIGSFVALLVAGRLGLAARFGARLVHTGAATGLRFPNSLVGRPSVMVSRSSRRH